MVNKQSFLLFGLANRRKVWCYPGYLVLRVGANSHQLSEVFRAEFAITGQAAEFCAVILSTELKGRAMTEWVAFFLNVPLLCHPCPQSIFFVSIRKHFVEFITLIVRCVQCSVSDES